ncbi:maleylpyruvate isomerase family mycothiol-dependent enzyme [Amycolatopsis deserti]|nr:maleylpyruvate isomerase family mycothiol-dependent enzyme [Amycolatopsis deserti]
MTQTSTIARPRAQDAVRHGEAELAAFLALLDRLDEDDWNRPTASAGWDVHAMVAHVAGQHEEGFRPVLFLRRLRRARRRYPERTSLDAHNAYQIDLLGKLGPGELRRKLAADGAKALRARRRVPGFLRRLGIARFFPEEKLVDPTFGYLLDVLSNRDTWMHRLEIARATGRPFETGDHDRAVVAQVVLELARSWPGPPIVLELTGPAGDRWRLGTGDPVATVTVDALDYLWLLSGRDGEPVVKIDGDESVRGRVLAARVVF